MWAYSQGTVENYGKLWTIMENYGKLANVLWKIMDIS
jgi:hypothetical protein